MKKGLDFSQKLTVMQRTGDDEFTAIMNVEEATKEELIELLEKFSYIGKLKVEEENENSIALIDDIGNGFFVIKTELLKK